jgi:hypothetical protein
LHTSPQPISKALASQLADHSVLESQPDPDLLLGDSSKVSRLLSVLRKLFIIGNPRNSVLHATTKKLCTLLAATSELRVLSSQPFSKLSPQAYQTYGLCEFHYERLFYTKARFV